MRGISEKWLERKSKTLSRKGLYEFLSCHFSQIPKGSKVLNVGAGGKVSDLLNDFARSKDFQVVTLDIDKERKPDIIGDVCDCDLGSALFDTVILSEVLEHLYSPSSGLQNLYTVLKPGGKLVLTTPFILPMHDRPHDYYRFTRYGLAYLLRSFREVQIRERNNYFEAIDVLWVRLLQTQQNAAKKASVLIIPLVFFLKRPLSFVLARFITTDAMTTGYVVTALK